MALLQRRRRRRRRSALPELGLLPAAAVKSPCHWHACLPAAYSFPLLHPSPPHPPTHPPMHPLPPQVGRKPSEIFVSDGSKCDIGRLQLMFGTDVTVALQARGWAAARLPRMHACVWWGALCGPVALHARGL